MSSPFFTALAPDARVQGSRDPLGLLPIWSRLGRRLIRNVTTVSGDLRGWTSLLVMVGLYRDRVDAGILNAADTDALMRAEQVIAYSRLAHGARANDVRGVGRAQARLHAHQGGRQPIPLGLSVERRILASQRAAGVWGQIASPAAASSLLDRARIALTPVARDFWAGRYGKELEPHARALSELMADKRGFAPASGDEVLARALARLHDARLDPVEVALYRDHVLHAGRGEADTQGLLVAAWRAADGPAALDKGVSFLSVAALAEQASRRGAEGVARGLKEIASAERLLAPVEYLFAWVQGRHRQSLDDVVDDVRQRWSEPLRSAGAATDGLLAPVFAAAYGDAAFGRLLANAREACVDGEWANAVRALVDLNAAVMRRRGGAPWVEWRDGRLDVRLGDEPSELPSLDRLHADFAHSYYLDPLRRLIVAWQDGQNG